ncbi:MAG: NADH-quinone oxidoreductase subunit A [Candidatus Omnitrophica bacterium]|nr:NADH-quinone oxidoreductase subunit A [Candidatus Omnitrophota bacterium]
MKKFLLTPPIAFLIILAASALVSLAFSKLSFKPKKKSDEGGESYACGEDMYDHMAQPDYSNFFPFAFFFTLAHVGTLIIVTLPVATLKSFNIAVVYIIGIVVGLSILFRK